MFLERTATGMRRLQVIVTADEAAELAIALNLAHKDAAGRVWSGRADGEVRGPVQTVGEDAPHLEFRFMPEEVSRLVEALQARSEEE